MKFIHYYNNYINRQNLEYSLSCAGKDRIKKEIEYVIIKNRIHEKEWKNEIEIQFSCRRSTMIRITKVVSPRMHTAANGRLFSTNSPLKNFGAKMYLWEGVVPG